MNVLLKTCEKRGGNCFLQVAFATQIKAIAEFIVAEKTVAEKRLLKIFNVSLPKTGC